MRTQSFELHSPSLCTVPTTIAQVLAIINGAIGSRIPDNKVWSKALLDYPQTNLLLWIFTDPGLTEDKDTLAKIHHIYQHPAFIW